MKMYGIRIESKHGMQVAKADGLTENMMIIFIGKVLPQYASDYYEISINMMEEANESDGNHNHNRNMHNTVGAGADQQVEEVKPLIDERTEWECEA